MKTECLKNRAALIFDMDGTLWDSSEQIVTSWNQTMSRFPQVREKLTLERLQKELGKTMDRIAVSLLPYLPQEEAVKIIQICGEEENRFLEEHGAVLYDGVEETLKELCSQRELYIVSNCQSGYIEAFLKYYGFGRYFKDIECYGNTMHGKADNIRLLMTRRGLTQAVYAGDTSGDENACRQAGIPFIYASYGFGTVSQPDTVIHSFTDLPAVMADMDQMFSDKK